MDFCYHLVSEIIQNQEVTVIYRRNDDNITFNKHTCLKDMRDLALTEFELIEILHLLHNKISNNDYMWDDSAITCQYTEKSDVLKYVAIVLKSIEMAISYIEKYHAPKKPR